MDFHWPEPDRLLIDTSRQFASSILAPRGVTRGFDREGWLACAREGYLALPLDRRWQGGGRSIAATAGAFEALGRGGADRGLLFSMGAHLFGCALTVGTHGTPHQAERFLPSIGDGTAIAALAITEPDGGTSAAEWRTRAAAVADGYTLSGEKMYVTNAPVADLFLVLAAGATGRGAFGSTAFLVPRDTPGLCVETLEPTTGLQGSPMGRVTLNDCRLTADAVLGAPGSGLAVLLTCMRFERTCILAGFIGAAAHDLAACVAFARGRRGRDGSIFGLQAVSHRLARMHCRIESARSMLYRGAAALDSGTSSAHDPSLVKLVVSEALTACALDAVQIFAGAAWTDTAGIGTALADTLAALSASGTTEAQLNAIASALPGLYPDTP